MRPQGRQSIVAGQAGPSSPGQAGANWLQSPLAFQGSDISETASTPTRVKQFLKKGVVKFQEVSLKASLCLYCGAYSAYAPADIGHVSTVMHQQALIFLKECVVRQCCQLGLNA